MPAEPSGQLVVRVPEAPQVQQTATHAEATATAASEPIDPSMVTLAKIHETGKTLRTLFIVIGFIAVAGIAAWSIVRIYTHEIWIEVLVLFFGPGGLVTMLLGFYLWRVKRKVIQAQKNLDAQVKI